MFEVERVVWDSWGEGDGGVLCGITSTWGLVVDGLGIWSELGWQMKECLWD